MIDFSILNLAVTLAFTYLIFSIMASTIHEIINSITNMRGKKLLKSLKELYSDENVKQGLRKWEDFYNECILTSPFIESLRQKKLFTNNIRHPSYIPSKNFSQAIYSILINDSFDFRESDLKNIIEENKNLPDQLKTTLITFLNEAKGDTDRFLKNIETFYENAMIRSSGEFKRYTQVWMFILGLIIAISLNVDSVYITEKLLGNKEKLELTANQIESQMNAINSMYKKFALSDSLLIKTSELLSTDSANTSKANRDSISVKLKEIQEQYALLKSAPVIPIGYDTLNYFFSDKDPAFEKIILNSDTTIIYKSVIPERIPKILGWLITTLAIYLGAPFWFEMINKFINLRGTGKKPEEFENPAKDKS